MSGLERWIPVPGYEGLYEASTFGRLRSLDRVVQHRNRWGKLGSLRVHGRVLGGGPHLGGYRTAHLYSGGVRWATAFHIVVALTFHGPCPMGLEVRHLNGRHEDNRPVNLRYGTRRENEADKELHGKRFRGEDVACAKLDTAQILEIRRRVGEPQKQLAEAFGCTFSNISAIQLRKSWTHV